MYHLPLTLETPAANLALDEALLEAAEAGEASGETLRLWESPAPMVVLGRSSALSEVHQDACRRDGVPILRRSSGGATVVAGPGCLMYAALLDHRQHAELRGPELPGVDDAHRLVLRRSAAALSALAPGVACAGICDLVLPGADGQPRKFCGNALRVRRRYVLYHGAILYDFPLDRISRWLAAPAREPDYRGGRAHADFLANLPASRAAIAAALVDAWQATEPSPGWPEARTAQLAATRYATLDWSAPRGAPATC